MIGTAAALDKAETVAYRLYLADFQLNEANDAMPKDWYELDADTKFNFLYLAAAAIREMADLPDDIMATVVDGYRNRSPYPIRAGETWESVTGDHFMCGWKNVFEQFGEPSSPKFPVTA